MNILLAIEYEYLAESIPRKVIHIKSLNRKEIVLLIYTVNS